MRSLVLAVLLVSAGAGCGGGGGGGGGGNGPAVTWSASPASGNLLPTQQIVVTFSATVQSGTAALGGTLAGQATALAWSDGAHPSDTATIRPATTWGTAARADLTLTVKDLSDRAVQVALPSLGVIPAADACGTAGGNCVNTADCRFTSDQLSSWSATCAQAGLGTVNEACLSTTDHPVSHACFVCYRDIVACTLAQCSAFLNPPGPCGAATASSPDCLACVAQKCQPTFATCSGR
jgi:hypothetical protein